MILYRRFRAATRPSSLQSCSSPLQTFYSVQTHPTFSQVSTDQAPRLHPPRDLQSRWNLSPSLNPRHYILHPQPSQPSKVDQPTMSLMSTCLCSPTQPPYGHAPSKSHNPSTSVRSHRCRFRRPICSTPGLHPKYAAVFVCMVTKAIHFELCASLSTEDFMATFRRFVARRGCPSHLFSDNGTNFLGAREEIRELQKLTESEETTHAVSTFTQSHGISWHFIPPRAPHFGGLWEAAVKSMKLLLRKNLQPHALRFDELMTVLLESEAILNLESTRFSSYQTRLQAEASGCVRFKLASRQVDSFTDSTLLLVLRPLPGRGRSSAGGSPLW